MAQLLMSSLRFSTWTADTKFATVVIHIAWRRVLIDIRVCPHKFPAKLGNVSITLRNFMPHSSPPLPIATSVFIQTKRARVGKGSKMHKCSKVFKDSCAGQNPDGLRVIPLIKKLNEHELKRRERASERGKSICLQVRLALADCCTEYVYELSPRS